MPSLEGTTDALKLIDQHQNALEELSFESTARINTGRSEIQRYVRQDRQETRSVISKDGARTEAWWGDRCQVHVDSAGQPHYQFDGCGTHPDYVNTLMMRSALAPLSWELSTVRSVGPERVLLFRPRAGSRQASETTTGSWNSIDGSLSLVGGEYIKSLNLTFESPQPTPNNERKSVKHSYEYTLQVDPGITISTPEFVADAPQIHARFATDNSHLVLEHTGGPSIPAGTQLCIDEDWQPFAQTTSTTDFYSGEVASLYWTDSDEVTFLIDQEPRGVARPFSSDTVVWATPRGEHFEVKLPNPQLHDEN